MEDQLSLFSFDFESLIEEKVEVKTTIQESIDMSENTYIKDIINIEKNTFSINEKVGLYYNDIFYEGIVRTIYNNGETLNCSFDEGRKRTAFYINNVHKLKI